MDFPRSDYTYRSQRRDQSIDELRANIERGHNVETSKRVLRAILRDNAGYHFVQSPEEERSEALQAMRNMPEFTAEDKVNLEAVIRDYDNGWLQCPPGGQGVVYFGGQRKTPYAVDVLDYPVVQKVDEWLAEGATGRMWIEQVG